MQEFNHVCTVNFCVHVFLCKYMCMCGVCRCISVCVVCVYLCNVYECVVCVFVSMCVYTIMDQHDVQRWDFTHPSIAV